MLQTLQKAVLDMYKDATASSTHTSVEQPKIDTSAYNDVFNKLQESNNLGFSDMNILTNSNAFKQSNVLPSVLLPSSLVPTIFASGKIGVSPLGNIASQYDTPLDTFSNRYTTLPQIPHYPSIAAMPSNIELRSIAAQPHTNLNMFQSSSIPMYGLNQYGINTLQGNRYEGMGFDNNYGTQNFESSFGNSPRYPSDNFIEPSHNYPRYGVPHWNTYGQKYIRGEDISAPATHLVGSASELLSNYLEPPNGFSGFAEPPEGNRGRNYVSHEYSSSSPHSSFLPPRKYLKGRVPPARLNNLRNGKTVGTRYAPSFQTPKFKPPPKMRYVILKST
ncbi:hypothetical protein RI129_000379 [Pyrocoelia pectoralis]|uniref:Uncharacterized protein n=1 Tax=Pyrocoelia pectoralis TaxID=417401 RepID=A0AAN7VK32_9COLE